MKNNLILIFIGVVLLGGVFIFSQNTPNEVYSDTDTSYNRGYWSSEIKENGVESVFGDFKNKNEDAPYERRHFSSHIIGELIFEHSGIEGIQYCDSTFAFGCYHGFFGRAVTVEGVSVIAQLDAVCVATYGPLGTGCQHGIGHGIMEYFGGERVNDALALCKDTTQLTTLLGCTSGVFMEYNTPLAGSENDVAPEGRSFNEEDSYAPCTQVGRSFADSCYFELGQWYAITFNKEYEKQGELCDGIIDESHRARCFMGLGTFFAPSFQYDVGATLSACERIGIRGEQSCLSGASWSFYAEPSVRIHAVELCTLDTEFQTDICLQRADLTEGLEQR